MGEALKRRLKQARFDSPVHEAMLNLMVAADHVRTGIDRVCAGYELTHGQYNVLRILRGAHPEGQPRCEIAARLVERAPDVTRLVDRLEVRGLVERVRSTTDRRLSITRITRKGLALLEEITPQLEQLFAELHVRLSPRDARELSRICESLYDDAA
ncbi:MAG TPA: MarR family transcriptional regulator [Pyrinomonadaceae bacterium]|jgi:DNA-binding MarR family transcriptional regulator